MKNRIDIFAELGKRLSGGVPPKVAERAVAENEWFRPEEIASAVEAICTEMLNHNKLQKWMAHYPTLPVAVAEDVMIVMAGNIPLVGFFDLLCVVMAGHKAYVKPSSKDSVLMEYVISTVKDIEPDIPIYIGVCENPSRVIATGGESAVRHFKSAFKGVTTLLRGSRHSIAVLSGEGEESIEEDIYAYSGLGCRNVSMIFYPKGSELSVKKYDTHHKYHNNYLQNRALLTMQGRKFVDNGSSLFIASSKFPSALSVISTYEYDSIEEVSRWIAEHDEELQCIVSSVIQHPRRVGFGESQKPTLMDYADEVDTMKFLM
ncbi:MAG: aldehyde dehydrogenase [Rikenellaceae bacterium]